MINKQMNPEGVIINKGEKKVKLQMSYRKYWDPGRNPSFLHNFPNFCLLLRTYFAASAPEIGAFSILKSPRVAFLFNV